MAERTCNHTGEKCTVCTCQATVPKDDFLNLAPPVTVGRQSNIECAYSIRRYTPEDEVMFEELGF